MRRCGGWAAKIAIAVVGAAWLVSMGTRLDAGAGEQPRKSSPQWQVQLRVSGGIAGISRTLSVTSGGTLIARDLRLGLTVERPIEERRAAEIAKALVGVGTAPEAKQPHPSRCRDCVSYDLEISLDRAPQRVRLSSDSLETSRYRELVTLLAGTLRDALDGEKQKPAGPR